MKEEVLALLEERPYRIAELTAVLGRSRTGVYDVLCGLRTAGRVRCSIDRWTLIEASSEPELPRRGGRQPAPGAERQVDRVLGGLRDGPRTSAEIAVVTSLPLKTCSAWLSQLLAQGRVVVVGVQSTRGARGHPFKRYGLAGQPAAEGPVDRLEVPPAHRLRAAALVDDRLLIEEPPAAGDAVCARCGTRFLRERAADQFCSTGCSETPAPSDTRIIVVDGIEYESTSIGGRTLTQWPDELTGGSSLGGRTYGVRHR